MRQPQSPQAQRGVVLLITLIVLAIISLLAITSVRNATSSESVSGNVRLTELATQSAELALRHCESSLLMVLTQQGGNASTYSSTFTSTNLSPTPDQTAIPIVPRWQRKDHWDSDAAVTSTPDPSGGKSPNFIPVYVLPLERVNQATLSKTTYLRPPECMVEKMVVMLGGNPAKLSTNSSFLITARGFGPEVVLPKSRADRPVGSEIWLQSQLIYNN